MTKSPEGYQPLPEEQTKIQEEQISLPEISINRLEDKRESVVKSVNIFLRELDKKYGHYTDEELKTGPERGAEASLLLAWRNLQKMRRGEVNLARKSRKENIGAGLVAYDLSTTDEATKLESLLERGPGNASMLLGGAEEAYLRLEFAKGIAEIRARQFNSLLEKEIVSSEEE